MSRKLPSLTELSNEVLAEVISIETARKQEKTAAPAVEFKTSIGELLSKLGAVLKDYNNIDITYEDLDKYLKAK